MRALGLTSRSATRVGVAPTKQHASRLRVTAPRAASFADAASSYKSETELKLIKKLVGLNRGALATSWDKEEVAGLVGELESTYDKSTSVTTKSLEGKWMLIYSSSEAFRSSPFFWAFAQGLVQDTSLANEIFRFTDAIPGAEVGAAYQTLDLNRGELVSEVDLSVFPGLKGTVVTTSGLSFEPPSLLRLTVESTRVSNSNAPLLGPILEGVAVPVQQVFERLRGEGASRVVAEVTFLDEHMRITRTQPDGQVFVYKRVGDDW